MLGRRRNVLSDRRQVALIVINMSNLLIAFLLAAIVLVLPDALVLYEPDTDEQARNLAASRLLGLDGLLWPALILLLMIAGVHSLIWSHRLLGPLNRIRAVLGDVRAGRLGVRATLRRGDLLHREAGQLNDVIDHLQREIAAISSAAAVARHAI